MNKMKVIKGLAFSAILALSLMATTGSAYATSPKASTPIVAPAGVTWEGSFTALGVTWE